MTMKHWVALLALPAMLAATAPAAQAQSFPNKPIRLVLPYSPGGIIDYVGRQIAQHLGDAIGQPVVAENRPGAGGITGTDTVARSAPDGYTLVLMDPAIVINPTLQPSMPYDLFKQLQTVSIVSTFARGRSWSRPQLPVKNDRGADRLRQGEPRQDELRLGRHRHHAASRRRIVHAAHRRRPRRTCPIAASASRIPT